MFNKKGTTGLSLSTVIYAIVGVLVLIAIVVAFLKLVAPEVDIFGGVKDQVVAGSKNALDISKNLFSFLTPEKKEETIAKAMEEFKCEEKPNENFDYKIGKLNELKGRADAIEDEAQKKIKQNEIELEIGKCYAYRYITSSNPDIGDYNRAERIFKPLRTDFSTEIQDIWRKVETKKKEQDRLVVILEANPKTQIKLDELNQKYKSVIGELDAGIRSSELGKFIAYAESIREKIPAEFRAKVNDYILGAYYRKILALETIGNCAELKNTFSSIKTRRMDTSVLNEENKMGGAVIGAFAVYKTGECYEKKRNLNEANKMYGLFYSYGDEGGSFFEAIKTKFIQSCSSIGGDSFDACLARNSGAGDGQFRCVWLDNTGTLPIVSGEPAACFSCVQSESKSCDAYSRNSPNWMGKEDSKARAIFDYNWYNECIKDVCNFAAQGKKCAPEAGSWSYGLLSYVHWNRCLEVAAD